MIWTGSWLWATRTVRSLAVGRFAALLAGSDCETAVRSGALSPKAGKLLQLSTVQKDLPSQCPSVQGQVKKAMPPPLEERWRGGCSDSSQHCRVLACHGSFPPLFWQGWATASSVLWTEGGIRFLEDLLVKPRSFYELKFWFTIAFSMDCHALIS